MSKRVLLEVCVASVDDALAAVAGGADRLELNCALSLGGLTPSAGLFAEVRRAVTIPIIAMIRPRPGGFCYSATDFDVMRRDATSLLGAGADGLAFGVLNANGEVDVQRCRQLREVCGVQTAVFHRSFDVTPEPFEALEILIDIGFARVMTSGQEATAYDGIPLIAELIRRGGDRIEILPAGGVNPSTIADVLSRTVCSQVHASLRSTGRDDSVSARPQVKFNSNRLLSESVVECTDADLVAALRSILNRLEKSC